MKYNYTTNSRFITLICRGKAMYEVMNTKTSKLTTFLCMILATWYSMTV